jgi:hypothetical protein
MSALDQKADMRLGAPLMSAIPPKADIGRHACYRCETLGAGARHKAANLSVAVTVVIGPHDGREAVGFGYNCPLNADTIMALLCVPIDVLHSDTIGKSAAQSVSARKAVDHSLSGELAKRPSSRATSWLETSVVTQHAKAARLLSLCIVAPSIGAAWQAKRCARVATRRGGHHVAFLVRTVRLCKPRAAEIELQR